MAELRLCPCCGGKARAKTFVSGRLKKKKFFYNECSVCGIRTSIFAEKKEADEAWNRRAEDGVGVQSKEKKLDICPKCGGELHCDRSAMLTTYPGQFRWECKDCGRFELRSEVLEDGK